MMSRLALRVLGLPSASKPSSTPTSPSAGITALAGASSESLPRSTSCMAAAPVTALVIEAIHTTVSGVISAASPSIRLPKPPS